MKNQPRFCRNLFVCTEINVRPDLYLMIYYMMFTVSVISDDIYLGLLQKKKRYILQNRSQVVFMP